MVTLTLTADDFAVESPILSTRSVSVGMHLFVFGLNHRSAPLALREKLAFPAETLPAALNDLRETHIAREAVVVSTCNRTEIYCVTTQEQKILPWMAHWHNTSISQLQPCLYQFDDIDAARHAFRVASGLDSMVLGETQIFGQLKDAVRFADREGTLGTHLNFLFQRTFSVAKEVRSKTEIGANSVSMAAAAVKLSQKIFPSINDLKILCIGAGEMITLVATHFAAYQPSCISVANRTLERGRALAGQLGKNAEAILFADLPHRLHEFDVVVSSTASTLPIIGKGLVERAIRQRRHKPVFMLDLAVPRDIEEEVSDLHDVYLYTVDDIATVVETGKEARSQAARQAELIINEHCLEFDGWLRQREVVPVIRALRDEAERVRRHSLEQALKQLSKGASPEEVLELMSQQLTNKLMHPPTQALAGSQGQNDELVDMIARLYRLNRDKD